jgi:hypothetical protein
MASMKLRFRQLGGSFAVCRLPADSAIPELSSTSGFTSVTRTGGELSIVCDANVAPRNAKCEAPWVCFGLEGPFPFALTGILASFIDPLAAAGVPIFAVATFDTDYVLVKEEHAARALEALLAAGHKLIS